VLGRNFDAVQEPRVLGQREREKTEAGLVATGREELRRRHPEPGGQLHLPYN
jgi:hypothetical protein